MSVVEAIKNDGYRESNFELLRIVAMLFIIFHHFVCYGYSQYASNRLLIPLNNIFSAVIVTLGKLGVLLFVLITGYFMINSNAKIKSWLSLYFQTFIYSVSILGIFLLDGVYISKENLFKSIMPITHSTYWFITTYLILYMLIPIINKILKLVKKKNFENLLLGVLTIIYLFVHTNITTFIYLYILGGYIKNGIFPLNKIKIKHCIYGIICLLLFITVYSAVNVYNCDNLEQILNNMHKLMVIHSPFILMSALCVFYIFKNLKIKTNKIINSVALSVFPVYLIHENFLIRPYLWGYVMKILNHVSPSIIIIFIVFMVVIIFIVCILIDKLFGYLYKPFIKKIVSFICTMLSKISLSSYINKPSPKE